MAIQMGCLFVFTFKNHESRLARFSSGITGVRQPEADKNPPGITILRFQLRMAGQPDFAPKHGEPQKMRS
jgi:hypothetical protein